MRTFVTPIPADPSPAGPCVERFNGRVRFSMQIVADPADTIAVLRALALEYAESAAAMIPPCHPTGPPECAVRGDTVVIEQPYEAQLVAAPQAVVASRPTDEPASLPAASVASVPVTPSLVAKPRA